MWQRHFRWNVALWSVFETFLAFHLSTFFDRVFQSNPLSENVFRIIFNSVQDFQTVYLWKLTSAWNTCCIAKSGYFSFIVHRNFLNFISTWMLIIDSSQQYDEELKILSDGIEDQRNLIDRLRLDNQTEMSGKRKKLEDAKERYFEEKVIMSMFHFDCYGISSWILLQIIVIFSFFMLPQLCKD